jgi:YD repeat-containing protein
MKKYILFIILVFLIEGSKAQTVNYKYDSIGRITQIIYPDSSIIKYSYDAGGNRISSIFQNGCANKSKPVITTNNSLTFCQGDSVTLTAGLGNSYLWSNGDTTQSIKVKTAGIYSVLVNYGYNCALTSNPDTINVNPLPAQPGTISGSNSVCQSSSQTYSINPVSGATSYTWTQPSGWSGTSTTTLLTTTIGSNGGSVLVHSNNGCGSSTDQTLIVAVNLKPPQPGTISGNNSACQGSSQTYSVSAVTSATSYTWTLPSGWTGSSSTNTITATVGASGGTISVHANNNCGSSIDQNLSATVLQAPPQPGTISGGTTVNVGQTTAYTINSVSGATGYNWVLSGGGSIISGQNTNLVTITWSTAGNYSLTVSATNSCGAGSIQTLNVVVSVATLVINPDNQFQIKVVPNPSGGMFYLTAVGVINKEINVEVYDLLGQALFVDDTRANVNNYVRLINLTKYANGAYHIKITIDKKTYLRTVLKQGG